MSELLGPAVPKCKAILAQINSSRVRSSGYFADLWSGIKVVSLLCCNKVGCNSCLRGDQTRHNNCFHVQRETGMMVRGRRGSMGVRGDGSTVLSRVIHTRCALLHRVNRYRRRKTAVLGLNCVLP